MFKHLFFLVLLSSFAQALPLEEAQNYWSGTSEILNEAPAAQVLQITTSGSGAPSLVVWELNSPVDMNRKFLKTWMQIDSLENWFAIEMRLSATADFSSYYAIPVQRFSDPEFNWLQPGDWRHMTFSLGEAEAVNSPDVSQIRYISFYVQDTAQAPLQVYLSGVEIQNAELPAILSFTFDDGDQSQWLGAQIMNQYGLRGTAYLMAREVDQDGFLTRDQLLEMQNRMGWSLSSHHATPLTEMSPAYLEEEMRFEIEFLNALGSFGNSMHFAYPLGKTNSSWVIPQVRQIFRSARRAGGGAETLPPADWHLLRAYNLTPETTPEQFRARVTQAQAQGEWLILMVHKLVADTPTSPLEYNIEKFEELVEVVHQSGIQVMTVDEVWQRFQVD